LWKLVLDHLKKRFRVILIDLPGHGFTKLGKKNRSSLEFIKEANHMFSNHDQELLTSIQKYLNNVLDSSEYIEL